MLQRNANLVITSHLSPHVSLLSFLPPPEVQQGRDGGRQCPHVLCLLTLLGGAAVASEGAASPAGSQVPQGLWAAQLPRRELPGGSEEAWAVRLERSSPSRWAAGRCVRTLGQGEGRGRFRPEEPVRFWKPPQAWAGGWPDGGGQ